MPLIYINEPNHFYTFELPAVAGAEIYIGTAANCQLALPGVEGLGEVHACISCQPEGYVITDMGYGTFANGAPIQADYLRPGVEYRLGAAVITLPVETAAVPQQAMPQQQVAAPQQAAAAAPATTAAAPATKKPALKKKAPLKTGATAGKAAAPAAALNDAARFKRKGDSTLFNMIYVIVLIAAAVYAGVALRHWQKTGNCLPGIVSDAPPAK